ncbi:hypothetical protein [Nocardiopsis sp. CC223A]|uniref:hypothetical protein n=1 Tax=Nocardiopsis sp. CC223A TaxID=3044051 RepID=UPI00278C89CB|nr:hypothetical protein [Nocardiopsis sp. CC223A]
MAKVVRIDTDALEEMQRSLRRIQNAFVGDDEDFKSPEDRAEGIGPRRLSDSAKDYGKDCKKNYERQAEDLGEFLNLLNPVITTFYEMDEELGQALKGDEKPPPPHHRNQLAY